jgi:hypothetical protein
MSESAKAVFLSYASQDVVPVASRSHSPLKKVPCNSPVPDWLDL